VGLLEMGNNTVRGFFHYVVDSIKDRFRRDCLECAIPVVLPEWLKRFIADVGINFLILRISGDDMSTFEETV
jgi:hypothetical protein